MKDSYILRFENTLYDFFISLGDQDLGSFNPEGGSYKGHSYEAGEVPLAVIAKATNYQIQGGLAYSRLGQLADAGLYRWRKLGTGKPSFVSLLVDDHDEHFAIKKDNRIQAVIEQRQAAKTAGLVLPPEFVAVLDRAGSTDEAYELLRTTFAAEGRGSDVQRYWVAYLRHKRAA